MHIAFITRTVGETSPTGIIRVAWAARWIAKYTPHTTSIYTEDDLKSWDIGYSINADVIVVHRLLNNIKRVLDQATENRKPKIIYDTDDYEIGAWGMYHNVSWLFDFPALLEYMLDKASLVTVASKPLAESLGKHTTKPIEYIPNGFDFMHDVYNRRYYEHNFHDPVIYWGGGTSHDRDLDMFIELGVIQDISRRYLMPWKFYSISPNVPHIKHENGSPIMSEFAVPINEYIHKLMRYATIAIAPLLTHKYDYTQNQLVPDMVNQNRSELKVIEAGVARLPIICSDVAPYRGHTEGVILVQNTRESWVSAIERLVNDPEECRRLGDINRDYAETNYNAYTITKQRIAAYTRALDL